jgi:DNA topoisomerase-1
MNVLAYISPRGQEVEPVILARLRRELRTAGDVEGHPFHGNQYTSFGSGGVGEPGHVSQDDSPRGLPPGAETEDGAERIFQSKLSELRAHGNLRFFHETPGDAGESIRQTGISSDIGVFAAINTPSNYVSGDKTIVEFEVPLGKAFIHPDMSYGWSDKLEHHQMLLKSSRPDLKGAYVSITPDTARLPPSWIKRATFVPAKRALGDFEGHPFHGNQWTTGGAGHEARAKELRVPPAWKNVQINKDRSADLQATGTDVKGRKQYLYSAAHTEAAAAEKFARMKEFNRELPSIRQKIAADLKDPNISAEDREAAAALLLIDRTAFRPGTDDETGGAVKAYGATTLEAPHVKIRGDELYFDFTAKKGVRVQKTIKDKELAAILRPRVAKGGRLFETSDDGVRKYLHSRDGDFQVKDFRTWHATTEALAAVKEMKPPTTQKEFDKARKTVGDRVAKVLGNTRAIALKSYIDPAVWSTWKSKIAKI